MWLRLVASKLLPKQSFGIEQFVSDNHVADGDEEQLASEAEDHQPPQRGPVSRSTLFPFMSEKIKIDHLFTEDYKLFVSTWNVGGVPPPDDLQLEDWLDTSNNMHDIYILGFQEIVPLSAGNVLGSENPSICSKWNSLIRSALNKRSSSQQEMRERQIKVHPVKDINTDDLGDGGDLDTGGAVIVDKDGNNYNSKKERFRPESQKVGRGDHFHCVVSKQMVGIMVSVWVRKGLRKIIRRTSVSCVGCGVMGCLGNKGSVSVRFVLNDTSFCVVCSHLPSGEKEGDESNRNWGASQIMSRTRFPVGQSQDLPRDILGHDRIIWLGDLNYRISLPDSQTRSLVEKHQWETLHERDQLRVELSEGGVFQGWKEGVIEFAPTYKYSPDSDEYYGWQESESKEIKKRAPAWCDRILWYGKGIKQHQYERGESKLSDHRPVRATFTVNTDTIGGIKALERCFSSERFESLESCFVECAAENEFDSKWCV